MWSFSGLSPWVEILDSYPSLPDSLHFWRTSWSSWGWTTPPILDASPHQPTTVCEDSGLSVGNSCLQYGDLKETVLAPFLFSLYTADFSHQSPHCHLQKFPDDSAIVGLIRNGDDRAYIELIKEFVDWCKRNHFQISAGHRQACTQVNIQATDIEMLTSYKYLMVHLDNNMDWTDHTAASNIQERSEQTPSAEQAQVLLSVGGTPDFLKLFFFFF